jgi:hypothetical protein
MTSISPARVSRLDEPDFDPNLLESALDDLLKVRDVAKAARGTDRLRSLSLTHRLGAVDPWADGNNSQFERTTGRRLYEESEFCVFNVELDGTYFRQVYDALPFTCGRMRIMLLPPLTIYKMHVDSSRRAHLALRTNEDARLVFRDGFTYHVPRDGKVHVLDTTVPHSAYNAGLQDRYHLAISVVE